MPYAGFLRRVVAYLMDVIPVTFVVAAVFYFFFGFDEALHGYFGRRPVDPQARLEFLRQRNLIRELSLGLYLIYSTLLESSTLRGTLGKWLVGIAVVDDLGRPLGFAQSLRRNCAKLVSLLPLGLGFFWAIWSPRRQAWHDMIASTVVVKRTPDFRSDREPADAADPAVTGGPTR
jgi:uncharacterized RDD family membrane protein YckC